jgi:hypothetical protein
MGIELLAKSRIRIVPAEPNPTPTEPTMTTSSADVANDEGAQPRLQGVGDPVLDPMCLLVVRRCCHQLPGF